MLGALQRKGRFRVQRFAFRVSRFAFRVPRSGFLVYTYNLDNPKRARRTRNAKRGTPMDFIKCERDGQLMIVTMARGKANALNSAIVDELSGVIGDAAASADVRGVVLASDRPKFFSGGFDVAEVFQYDRETMTEFFGRFIDLYEKML